MFSPIIISYWVYLIQTGKVLFFYDLFLKMISLFFKNNILFSFSIKIFVIRRILKLAMTRLAIDDLDKQIIDHLKEDAIVVFLIASPEVILHRVSADNSARPLLEKDDKVPVIKNLLEFRQPLYEQAADLNIDTSNLEITAVGEQIITELKEYEGSNP